MSRGWHWRALWGAQARHSVFEGLALEGAVEEQALELGSNSYAYMPPASPGAHERLLAGLRWPVGLHWPQAADLL